MEAFLTILVAILTVVLVLASAFMVIVILMQRASSTAGLGSALGGGAAESAFGAATGNVLVRATIISAIVFFALAYALHLLYLGKSTAQEPTADLPAQVGPVAPEPGATPSTDPDATGDATAPDATGDAASAPVGSVDEAADDFTAPVEFTSDTTLESGESPLRDEDNPLPLLDDAEVVEPEPADAESADASDEQP